MSHVDEAPAEVPPQLPPPPASPHPRGFLRWVTTQNPFYVVSAGLFLYGLRSSFAAQPGEVETWALLSGLAGYTLLLAVTAVFLVRYAGVWDDVRTLMLLVVLMFLATSVLFDEVLMIDPTRGLACFLVGLSVAVAVSEGLFRGTGLRLPALFRAPYYALLGLFFLYPLAVVALPADPSGETVTWALWGFAPAAGLVFLTLLPAARRGPAYTRDNGSPWPWPLYPWVLFGVLGFGVVGRSFLLCWSLHPFEAAGRGGLVFGPYFLIPFGLAVAAVVLEIGLAPSGRRARGVALLMPAALVLLALVGHRPDDPVYQGFLQAFTGRLGGNLVYLSASAAVLFYVYAAVRGVPGATAWLTMGLAGLSQLGTGGTVGEIAPHAAPLVLAGVLQLGLGVRLRESWRCLLGSLALVAAVHFGLAGVAGPAVRFVVAYHLVIATLWVLGAVFRKDDLAEAFPGMASLMVMVAAVGWVNLPDLSGVAPWWAVWAYPAALAAATALYGRLMRDESSQIVAGLVAVGWLVAVAWQGYEPLRQLVTGLDYVVAGLAAFAVAVWVSLWKAGRLPGQGTS